MTIYEELIQRVSEGESFHIDFEKRTMKIGKQKVIDDGVYDESRTLINNPSNDVDVILNTIEVLYCNYKYSLPSERSENKRKRYFEAYAMEDIPDDRLFNAEHREIANARLEGYILCMVLKGNLKWDAFAEGKWFWQSETDQDLVILKKWIESK